MGKHVKQYKITITRTYVQADKWDLERMEYFITKFRDEIIAKLKAEGKWIESTQVRL